MAATRTSWLRLLSFLRPYVMPAVGGMLAIGATSIATLGGIPVARLAAETFGNLTLPSLNTLIAALMGVYVAKGFFTWLANLSASYVSLKTIRDVRLALFEHLQRLDLAYFEKRAAGDLSARLVADVNLLKDALTVAIGELAPSLLIVVLAIAYTFFVNWHLAALSLIGMPIVGVAIARFADSLRDWSSSTQSRIGDMLAYLNERLSHVLLVKSFSREAFEAERFADFNDAHFHATFQGARVQSLQTPVVGTLQIIAIGAVLWLGGFEILHARLSVPDLLAFAAAIGVCIDPILVVSNAFGKIQQAAGALDRIFEVLDAQPALTDSPNAHDLPAAEGSLRLRGVSFAYGTGAEVLRGIDLDVPAGSIVALVGPSGGGKSTVTKLIQRFYDPTRGSITFDGCDLRELKLTWLREHMGYVSQDTSLFASTVQESIRYGRLSATAQEIVEAAEAANAHDFIMAMPQGYETAIGERGAMLSGGQRQRLAIARALLRDPKVLILDEATSALDVESESLVQEALERLMRGRTTLVVAHRLSTIQRADLIVTLAGGEIVERGTHRDLMAQGGLYAQWCELQTLTR